jgi:hypothetical protein
MPSERERHEPVCLVAHNMLNTLSAIMGRCDLLIEKIHGTEYVQELATIRGIADRAVQGLVEHQQQVEIKTRSSGRQKAG